MNSIISSKGPYNNEYSSLDTEKISNDEFIISYMKYFDGGILWIRSGSSPNNSDIITVSKNLDVLNKPTILVTSDGYISIPSGIPTDSVESILNCNNIVKWYSQNYDQSIIHEKLQHFPVGFNFHTKHNINNELTYMLHARLSKKEKIENLVFCDSHLNITANPERIDIFNKFVDNQNFRFLKKRLEFTDIIDLYNNFLFVVSPLGFGLDCHRTWECFLAGCIVIKKSSPLDEMFIKNKLPVVIIDDWNSLNDDLPNKLIEWKQQYLKYTDIFHIYERLQFNYWLS